MGYTHYWKNEKEITDKEWGKIETDFKTLLKATSDIALEGELISNEVIVFNGYEDEGYETFYLTRETIEFGCCKTARKPYDLVVCVLLKIVEKNTEGFSYSSDGSPEDWEEANTLFSELFSGLDESESNLLKLDEWESQIVWISKGWSDINMITSVKNLWTHRKRIYHSEVKVKDIAKSLLNLLKKTEMKLDLSQILLEDLSPYSSRLRGGAALYHNRDGYYENAIKVLLDTISMLTIEGVIELKPLNKENINSPIDTKN